MTLWTKSSWFNIKTHSSVSVFPLLGKIILSVEGQTGSSLILSPMRGLSLTWNQILFLVLKLKIFCFLNTSKKVEKEFLIQKGTQRLRGKYLGDSNPLKSIRKRKKILLEKKEKKPHLAHEFRNNWTENFVGHVNLFESFFKFLPANKIFIHCWNNINHNGLNQAFFIYVCVCFVGKINWLYKIKYWFTINWLEVWREFVYLIL